MAQKLISGLSVLTAVQCAQTRTGTRRHQAESSAPSSTAKGCMHMRATSRQSCAGRAPDEPDNGPVAWSGCLTAQRARAMPPRARHPNCTPTDPERKTSSFTSARCGYWPGAVQNVTADAICGLSKVIPDKVIPDREERGRSGGWVGAATGR